MAGSVKKTPMRMCLGCNEMKPKRDLIRVVKTPEGDVLLDLTGKKSGRGAYICKSVECMKKAGRSRRFEKAFSMQIDDEIYRRMEEQLTESGDGDE